MRARAFLSEMEPLGKAKQAASACERERPDKHALRFTVGEANRNTHAKAPLGATASGDETPPIAPALGEGCFSFFPLRQAAA